MLKEEFKKELNEIQEVDNPYRVLRKFIEKNSM